MKVGIKQDKVLKDLYKDFYDKFSKYDLNFVIDKFKLYKSKSSKEKFIKSLNEFGINNLADLLFYLKRVSFLFKTKSIFFKDEYKKKLSFIFGQEGIKTFPKGVKLQILTKYTGQRGNVFNIGKIQCVTLIFQDMFGNKIYLSIPTFLYKKLKLKYGNEITKINFLITGKVSGNGEKYIKIMFPDKIEKFNGLVDEFTENIVIERHYKINGVNEEKLKKLYLEISKKLNIKYINSLDYLDYFKFLKELNLYSLGYVFKYLHGEEGNNLVKFFKAKKRFVYDKIILTNFSMLISKKYKDALYKIELLKKFDLLNKIGLKIEPINENGEINNELLLFFNKKEYLLSNNYVQKIREIKDKIFIEYKILKDILRNKFKIELTESQKLVIENVLNNKFGNFELLNGILQGDVGTGKTFVLFILALIYQKIFQKQVVITTPIGLLIEQHYEGIKKYFGEYLKENNIKIGLLKGGIKNKEKKEILNQIKKGEINIIFGTQSLMQKSVEYHDLGFVIFDEQHKFGVKQRSFFNNYIVNVLNVTATPIPRTIALNVLMNQDYYKLTDFPFGPKKIETQIFKENQFLSKKVKDFIHQEINKGGKIFVIANKIGNYLTDNESIENKNKDYKNEKRDLEFAIEEFKKLGFKDNEIITIHGKLKSEEKDNRILDFKNDKNKKILIATTVVEVGIDIPEASIIVIFDADNFGLATLHQLRGRVGRKGQKSYCFLVVNNNFEMDISNKSYKRLKIMEKSLDGNKIAEKDLDLRGIGQILGINQSGIADIDISLLEKEDGKKIEKLVKTIYNNVLNNNGDEKEKYLFGVAKKYSKLLI